MQDDSSREPELRESVDLKPQDSSPSRIAAAPVPPNPTLRESETCGNLDRLSRQRGRFRRLRPLRSEHRPHRALARRVGLRQRQSGRHQGAEERERAGAPRVRTLVRAGQVGPVGQRRRRRGRHRRERLSGSAVPRRRGDEGHVRRWSRRESAASSGRATPRRTATSPLCASSSWFSPRGLRAPARPGLRSATPCRCSSRALSSG